MYTMNWLYFRQKSNLFLVAFAIGPTTHRRFLLFLVLLLGNGALI